MWDGHNDVPEQLRARVKDVLAGVDFNDTTKIPGARPGQPPMMTDLPRIAKGHLGAQFWSVYVSADLPEPQAVQATLEQIDVMKRLIARYPGQLQYCEDSACVTSAWRAHRVASLLGEAGVNIGTFALGRDVKGGSAIALVSIDGPAPNGVLAKVGQIPGVRQAKALQF